MTKRVLFINDHLTHIDSNIVANFAGVITRDTIEIDYSKSYAVSPIEIDYDSLVLLSKKFDEVVFLTDHNNYTVRILQEALRSEIEKKSINKVFSTHSGITFFGCSHTYGSWLEDRETNAYPYVLSKMLGEAQVHNLATPGESNYAILEYFSNISFKNGMVIVQFTDMYRISDYQKKKTIKVYDTPIRFNELILLENFKTIVNEVVNRLRDSDCKFLLTFTVHYDNEYDLHCLEYLLQFEEFVPSSGIVVDLASDGLHYGVKSHALWAARLFNKWNKLYD